MVYFISGHRDITVEEFSKHYARAISDKVSLEPDCKFVVGDCRGVDSISQQFLAGLVEAGSIEKERITVYHMFTDPRNNEGFKCIGGFKSDVERDSAMTDASDVDIAWVRAGREGSGTHQNIVRRMRKKHFELL